MERLFLKNRLANNYPPSADFFQVFFFVVVVFVFVFVFLYLFRFRFLFLFRFRFRFHFHSVIEKLLHV